jgi:flagellar biosynthesis protein FliR
MSDLFWTQPEWLLGFGMVSLRLICFFVVLPAFPGGPFGVRLRAITALWLAWIFQMASPLAVVEMSLAWTIYNLTASACIGLVLGFAVRLSLDALHSPGHPRPPGSLIRQAWRRGLRRGCGGRRG